MQTLKNISLTRKSLILCIQNNNGGYTKGVKPEVKSVRYADDGSELKRISKAPVAVAEQPKKVVAKKVVAKKAVVKKRVAKRA